MANVKVSNLPELGSGSLDPVADFLLVSDASAVLSKKIKPSEVIKGALATAAPFWDFTTGVLPATVSFTRASAGYRFNSSGVLVSETTDVARFDYTPVTLAARGLLIEEARTENYTYNTTLSNAVWSYGGCTPTHNSTAGPDGTVTATLVTEGVTTSQNIGRTALSYTSGVTYMHRIYAKANTRNWIAVYWDPNRFGGTGFSYFDVSTGTLGTPSVGMTTFIRPVANGFYECVVIGTCTSSGAGNNAFFLANANGGRIYTGDGVSSLYVWGPSLQVGSTSGQFIATGAAAVTRALDVATINNSLVLTDQCWIVRARTPRKLSGVASNMVLTVDNGGSFDRRLIYYSTAGTLIAAAVVGNVTTGNMILGSVAADTDFAVAVRWADNNFAASLNGGAIVTDLSGANPLGLTTARVGRDLAGNYWNSTIKTIETRRTATDAELPLLAA